MLLVAVETFSPELAEEVKPLLRQHWEEIANHKEHIPLDVDFDTYYRLQTDKKLIVLTVRDAGLLVGYAAFFLLYTCHYKSSLFALNDVIWLHPDYRKGSAGLRLIAACENVIARTEAKKISWHVKPVNGMRAILEARGYVLEELSLGKAL